jgi:cell division protein ZapA (FtsZ GTPase activity inhibitor)
MSNEEKNRVIAKLGYHKFTIKSHKSSEHIQQVSRDINQLLADIGKKNQNMSMEEMALLVALNIQSDNLDLQDQMAAKSKENADLMVRVKSMEHTMGTLVKEIADIEKEKIREEQEKASSKSSTKSKANRSQTKTSTKQATHSKAKDKSADKQGDFDKEIPEISQPSLKSSVNTVSKQLGRLRQTPRS